MAVLVAHLAVEISLLGVHVKIALPTDEVWLWRDAFPLACKLGLLFYSHYDDHHLLLSGIAHLLLLPNHGTVRVR